MVSSSSSSSSYQPGTTVCLSGDCPSNDNWWNEQALLEQAFGREQRDEDGRNDIGGEAQLTTKLTTTPTDPMHGMDNNKKTALFLQGLDTTPTLAEYIVRRIRSEASTWIKFSISECPENDHLHQVVDAAASTFSQIVVADLRLKGTSLMQSLSTRGLQPNGILQRLEFREVFLTTEQVTVLSELGLAQTTALRELSFGTVTFESVRNGEEDANDDGAFQRLVLGLRANTSLEKLHIVRSQLRDGHVARVADALSRHPRLIELDLSGNYCRQLGFRALSKLLSLDGCKLSVLKLNDQYYNMGYVFRPEDDTDNARAAVAAATTVGMESRDDVTDYSGTNFHYRDNATNKQVTTKLHLEELLDGLERNTSLCTLELSRNELVDVDALMSILWKCPKLRSLNLLGNRITHLKSWRRFWAQPRPSRLQKLELSYNPFHYCTTRHHVGTSHQHHHSKNHTGMMMKSQREENAKFLLRLLESHPELFNAGRRVAPKSKPSSSGVSSNRHNDNGDRFTRNRSTDATAADDGRLLFWKDTPHQAKIQHFLDLNKTGRVLVANNAMPLSVWPHVLERANRRFEGSRRANVIFHLLHGPVTGSR